MLKVEQVYGTGGTGILCNMWNRYIIQEYAR